MSSQQSPASTTDRRGRGTSEPPEAHTVHVRFLPAQGARLRRRTPEPIAPCWTERPILMERVDGSYDLVGTTAQLDTLVRWILSHGSDAKVKGPEALRRRIRAEARRIVRQYAEGDDSSNR